MESIPRICTITGVEPNQAFYLPHGEHNPYYIDPHGQIIGSDDLKADSRALEDLISLVNRSAYMQVRHTCSENELDHLKAARRIGFQFVGRDREGKVFLSVVNPAFCDGEQVLGLYRYYPVNEVRDAFGFMHENTTMRIDDAIADYLRQ